MLTECNNRSQDDVARSLWHWTHEIDTSRPQWSNGWLVPEPHWLAKWSEASGKVPSAKWDAVSNPTVSTDSATWPSCDRRHHLKSAPRASYIQAEYRRTPDAPGGGCNLGNEGGRGRGRGVTAVGKTWVGVSSGSRSAVRLFVIPSTVTRQAPLSMESSTQEWAWVAIPFSRGSSWPRDGIRISCRRTYAGRFFTIWSTRQARC